MFHTYVDGVEFRLDMHSRAFRWSGQGEAPLSFGQVASIARSELEDYLKRDSGWGLREVRLSAVAAGKWIYSVHFMASGGDGSIVVGITENGEAVLPVAIPCPAEAIADNETSNRTSSDSDVHPQKAAATPGGWLREAAAALFPPPTHVPVPLGGTKLELAVYNVLVQLEESGMVRAIYGCPTTSRTYMETLGGSICPST